MRDTRWYPHGDEHPLRRWSSTTLTWCHLDYRRLGQIGDQVAAAIRLHRCRRFAQQAVLDLLVDGVQNGRVSEEGLADKLRTRILDAL